MGTVFSFTDGALRKIFLVGVLFSGPVLINPHLGGTVILENKTKCYCRGWTVRNLQRGILTQLGCGKKQKFFVGESCLWYTSWLISY